MLYFAEAAVTFREKMQNLYMSMENTKLELKTEALGLVLLSTDSLRMFGIILEIFGKEF